MNIKISLNAQKKILDLKKKHPEWSEKPLRIYLSGKNCDGFVYGVMFDEKLKKDKEIVFDGFSIVLSINAAKVLDEANLDYVEEEDLIGFLVTNPKQEKFKGKFWKKPQIPILGILIFLIHLNLYSSETKSVYKYLKLSNEMKVLLVHNPNFDSSAVALKVNTGSGDEEKNQLGLAHYLEHMLFLGSKNFPKIDGFLNFTSENNGFSNAFTDFDKTCYFFEIKNEKLSEAIKQFSDFFINPLFDKDYSQKEKEAVNSEYNSKFNDNLWRFINVSHNLMDPNHPYSRFKIGNLKTLKEIQPEDSKKFFNQFYSANQMSLVVASPFKIEEQIQMIQAFLPIKNNNIIQREYKELIVNKNDQILFYKPIIDSDSINIFYNEEDEKKFLNDHTKNFVHYLLNNEGKNSLQDYLKNKNLIYRMGINTIAEFNGSGLGFIKLILTKKGLSNYKEVLKIFYDYVDYLKNNVKKDELEERFNQLKEISKINFEKKELPEPKEIVVELALKLDFYPNENIEEKLEVINSDFNYQNYQNYLNNLKSKNTFLVLETKEIEFKNSKKDDFFSSEYKIENFNYNDFKNKYDFKLIEKNKYITELKNNLKIEDNLNIYLEVDPNFNKKNLKTKFINFENNHRLIYTHDDLFLNNKSNLILKLNFNKENLIFEELIKKNLIKTIYLNAINHNIENFIFEISAAGNEIKQELNSNNFNIFFETYTDKLDLIVKDYFQNLNKKITPDIFNISKNEILQEIINLEKDNPINLLKSYMSFLEKENSIFSLSLNKNQLALIEHKDIENFQKKFLDSFKIEASYLGNEKPDKVIQIIKQISNFENNNSKINNEIKIRNFNLKNNVSVIHYPLDENLFLFVKYFNNLNLTEALILKIIANKYSSKAFEDLRTKNQLGYIVQGFIKNIFNNFQLGIIIQSRDKNWNEIYSKILSFNNSFLKYFLNLENSEIENVIDSLIKSLEEKPKNLLELNTEIFYNFFMLNKKFELKKESIVVLNSLKNNVPKIKEYAKKFLNNNNNENFIIVHSSKNKIKNSDLKYTFNEIKIDDFNPKNYESYGNFDLLNTDLIFIK